MLSCTTILHHDAPWHLWRQCVLATPSTMLSDDDVYACKNYHDQHEAYLSVICCRFVVQTFGALLDVEGADAVSTALGEPEL
jgi:hypothetical protein